MRITKGQLVITVKLYPEGYLASVNKKPFYGCTGFFAQTAIEAIENALKFFNSCFW